MKTSIDGLLYHLDRVYPLCSLLGIADTALQDTRLAHPEATVQGNKLILTIQSQSANSRFLSPDRFLWLPDFHELVGRFRFRQPAGWESLDTHLFVEKYSRHYRYCGAGRAVAITPAGYMGRASNGVEFAITPQLSLQMWLEMHHGEQAVITYNKLEISRTEILSIVTNFLINPAGAHINISIANYDGSQFTSFICNGAGYCSYLQSGSRDTRYIIPPIEDRNNTNIRCSTVEDGTVESMAFDRQLIEYPVSARGDAVWVLHMTKAYLESGALQDNV